MAKVALTGSHRLNSNTTITRHTGVANAVGAGHTKRQSANLLWTQLVA